MKGGGEGGGEEEKRGGEGKGGGKERREEVPLRRRRRRWRGRGAWRGWWLGLRGRWRTFSDWEDNELPLG